MLKERTFPTLNLDDLPSNVVITYTDGVEQHISKLELITRVKGYRDDGKEKRRRSKNHNQNIGMTMSFNAIKTALVDEGDTPKAKVAVDKAKKKYEISTLTALYAKRLESIENGHHRAKVKNFLAKHDLG